jgi:hypothetical protein
MARALHNRLPQTGFVESIMSTPTVNSPRVSFASLTPNNIGTVRKLNSVLFPIKYSEKFYQDILLPDVENFCKLGIFQFAPHPQTN